MWLIAFYTTKLYPKNQLPEKRQPCNYGFITDLSIKIW